MQPGHPIVNLAENYIGFNCSVVFAENYLEAASASEPAAPVSLHPAAWRQALIQEQSPQR